MPKERVEKKCANVLYRPVRDHTIMSLGGVTVGAESIKNIQLGIGIASHELGHGLSYFYQKQSDQNCISEVTKVTDCLKDLHKNYFDKIDEKNKSNPPKLMDFGPSKTNVIIDSRDKRGRDFYMEEDFADLVASQSSTSSNFWCNIFALIPDLNSARADKTESLATNYLDNSLVTDEHSSEIFRLLHIETASRKTLHKSCTELLRQEKYNLKSCL